MRAAAKEMIKRDIKGSIVVIASMSGHVVNRGMYPPARSTPKAKWETPQGCR